MLERMYWVCADAVTLAAQLGTATDLPSPEVLSQRIANLFDNMRRKGQEAGIPAQDVAEAMYALSAFMDEQILRSPWPGRQQWTAQPLQFVYFQENTAGEGFFQRMQALEAQPERAHALEIYFLCIALGFQGRYALTGGNELLALQERAAAQLSRHVPPAETLSPEGYAEQAQRTAKRSRLPLVTASLVFLGAAVALFVVLKLVLSFSAADAAEVIRGPVPVSLAPRRLGDEVTASGSPASMAECGALGTASGPGETIRLGHKQVS